MYQQSFLSENARVFQFFFLGVAKDLSHIETAAKVTHAVGKDKMKEVLCGGVDVVVVTAGKPRQPGMTRDDLFKENAQIAFDVATVQTSTLFLF